MARAYFSRLPSLVSPPRVVHSVSVTAFRFYATITDALPVYHVHEKPVPTDGNCTGTGAHLDPYKRGETPPCDATNPAQCQTGDLSGKYGHPVGPGYSIAYGYFSVALFPVETDLEQLH
jgi:hypothetical protein